MMLANEDVKMIQYTSAEITAPFLLPEMVRSSFSYSLDLLLYVNSISEMMAFGVQAERIAAMLNYFLLQLVGPQRKTLRVKDPEKYEFRPKELLAQVRSVVHIWLVYMHI